MVRVVGVIRRGREIRRKRIIMSDLLVALYFISVISIPVYVFSSRKKRKSRKRKRELRRMMEQCSHEDNMRLIFKAYRENEIAAEAKYIGAIVRVEGTVNRITTGELSEYDVFSRPVVVLSGYVSCYMLESERERLMEIRVTDKVNVYGVVVGFGLDPDRLILKDCLIQTEEGEQDGHQ